MFFKDWRVCSQEVHTSIVLDPTQFYYLQAQAWHLKGYLGGTHSYCAFYDKEWLVVELTDLETVAVQQAGIIYKGTDGYEHAPFITNRPYNARWFGHTPYIVDSCSAVESSLIFEAVKNYPNKKFNVLHYNCNTFTSYLIATLGLNLKRPLRSVGFRNKSQWAKLRES